jgi:hypothetical protein
MRSLDILNTDLVVLQQVTLLTPDLSQPKTRKGRAQGWSTAVLHLAPHKLGGRGNVCPWASAECIAGCLNTAGRGGIGAGTLEEIRAERTNVIQRARIRRTRLFFDGGADLFVSRLEQEIASHRRRAIRNGLRPAVRLNGTSDIQWEKVAPGTMERFSDVVFYDYTKAPYGRRPAELLPSNYSLTMSYSGHNAADCRGALDMGRNVAIVFAVKRGAPLPQSYWGFDVVDGDKDDLRFLDPSPAIVGLRAKGRAISVNSPFVVRDF